MEERRGGSRMGDGRPKRVEERIYRMWWCREKTLARRINEYGLIGPHVGSHECVRSG